MTTSHVLKVYLVTFVVVVFMSLLQGVNMVINYDFPQSAVSYIHRIGRTGRAGRHGVAVTLFTESDMDSLRSIANVMRLSGCEVSPGPAREV